MKYLKYIIPTTILTLVLLLLFTISIVPAKRQVAFKETNVFFKTRSNDFFRLTTWNVNKGEVSIGQNDIRNNSSLPGNTLEGHKKIVDNVKAMLTENLLLTKVYQINVYTDGEAGVVGYVEPDSNSMKWSVNIDIQNYYNVDGSVNSSVNETIVHEIGHIVTLDINEALSTVYGGNKATQFDQRESTYDNSVYHQFMNAFWSDEDLTLIDSIYDAHPTDDSAARYEIYDKLFTPEKFVSQYASSKPSEDVAESFRAFVFENKPTGESLKEKKIRFFYGDEKMVALRNHMRSSMEMGA